MAVSICPAFNSSIAGLLILEEELQNHLRPDGLLRRKRTHNLTSAIAQSPVSTSALFPEGCHYSCTVYKSTYTFFEQKQRLLKRATVL
jgi:hypothetical protein